MRAIWKESGAAGEAPVPGSEPLSTESALAADFWTDIKDALITHQRRLWVLFDDLDKGPGRADVRVLAEVLAVRLKDISFQQRIRLVLLGYPDPSLPKKVKPTLVRNDTTEDFEVTHVQAFLDYCLTLAGKNFDPASLPAKAKDLHDTARGLIDDDTPFSQALNQVLSEWHRGL